MRDQRKKADVKDRELRQLGLLLLLLSFMLLGFGERPRDPAEISTNKDTYLAGENVKISLKFTNISSEAISSCFPSSQKFDLIVADAQGNEIWRWSQGKMFLMVIQPFKLESGKSVTYSYVWDQKDNSGKAVPPGEYYLSGEVKVRPGVKTGKKKISIKKA